MANDLDIPTLKWNLSRVLGNQHLELPANALVLDTETTGLSPADHKIWQVGLYPVKDSVPVYPEGDNIYLRWPAEMLKKADFEISRRRATATTTSNGENLDTRVRDGAYYKAEQGFIDEIHGNGLDPKEALESIVSVIDAYIDKGYPLVGQNFYHFDLPHMIHVCQDLGVKMFNYQKAKLVDTGMMIKAAKLQRKIGATESCFDFYDKISAIRAKGVYYAIERYCIPRWNLDVKYGFDKAKTHAAGFDTMVTWYILKELVNEVLKEEMVTNATLGG